MPVGCARSLGPAKQLFSGRGWGMMEGEISLRFVE